MKYKPAILNAFSNVWDEFIFLLVIGLILTLVVGIWIGLVYIPEIIGPWGILFIPALYLVGVFMYALYQEILQKAGEENEEHF